MDSRITLSVRRQNELAAMPDPAFPVPVLFDRTPTDDTIVVDPNVVDTNVLETNVDPIESIEESADAFFMNGPNDVSVDIDVTGFGVDCMSDSRDGESDASKSDGDFEPLGDILRDIFIEDNVSLSTMTKILHALHHKHPYLPLDARTLLHKKPPLVISNVGSGRYHHLGIKDGLMAIKNFDAIAKAGETLNLMFNIDGLPVTKGGESTAWPILCRIVNIESDVFAVGIYGGRNKPDCFNSYLNEFVLELKDLVMNGFNSKGVAINVAINGFIMDAPASASVLYIAPYNAYYGCRKCETKGKWEGKVTFPELDANLRNDVTFRVNSEKVEKHHSGTSILQSLPIDMVADIPLDPMHLLYLGVMKKLIGLWINRKKGCPNKLTVDCIARLNSRIGLLSDFYPQEFQRKSRRIDHFKMWKATEFRVFLMYSGPVVLQGIISKSMFKHFMALSTAARILSSDKYLEQNDLAHDLLKYFVAHFGTLYGEYNITFNVHCLIHLARDSAKFGPLETFSAFKFESYLGQLKRRVRSPYKTLEQMCNRVYELRSSSALKCQKKRPKMLSKPIIGTEFYSQANFENFTIRAKKDGNNCVFLKCGDAVKIVKFKSDSFYAKKVMNVCEFFERPCSLKQLQNIFVGEFSDELNCYKIADIACKLSCFPFKEKKFYFAPLIHTI